MPIDGHDSTVVDLGDGRFAQPVILVDSTGETGAGVGGGGGLSIAATPTITAGAYSALDAVGGLLTFAGAARVTGGSILIHTVVVTDLAKVSAALVLVLFDRTFTATADNGAFDPSDADLANCIGSIPIATTDYQALNDNGVATVRGVGLGPLTLLGTSLFGQLMLPSGSAPTYASTADLTVKVGVVQVN